MPSPNNNYQRQMAGFAVLLFIVMWVSMTTGHVALLSLLHLHKFEEISSSTWYICVCIVLEIPHLFNIAHCVWGTSFICVKKWTKWPTVSHLCTGILASLLEVACLSVLFIEFAPLFPAHILLLLSGSVYSVPAINEYIKQRGITNKTKLFEDECINNGGFKVSPSPDHLKTKFPLKPAIFCLSILIPLIISGILFTWSPYKLHLLHVFLLPIILLLLSILWTPKVQVDFYRSSDGRMDNRRKTSMMYAIVKTIAVPFCISIVLLTRFKDLRSLYFIDFISNGFHQLSYFHVYILVILISLAGMFVVLTGLLCAKMGLTTTGMLIPSMMSMPTVIGINLLQCVSVEEDYCNDYNIWIIVSSILAALVWLLPLLIYGAAFTRPSDILLKPFQESFLQFSWIPLFLDQYLLLNYYPDGFGDSQQSEIYGDLNTAKCKSKVFICTTMYNEKESEMKRLLQSLNNVAKSPNLQYVYKEAHIFMDNGSKDNRLTKNSMILISLIKSLDNIRLNSLKTYLTPYGIQMNWTLRNDFQCYVHFKDCQKFKAKKRWSQVMYMNYILNYRCKILHFTQDARQTFHTMESVPEYLLGDIKCTADRLHSDSLKQDETNRKISENENYTGKSIRSKKRQSNHSSVLKMELGKLQCLLKSNYNVHYENIDASSCKHKMHSEYSKAPIIQTISNVLQLLNKRQYSRYMTVNSELPFQITNEESSSEESGIQSIANTISVDSLEFSPGITSEDDIIDASGNEDESTDVSSSNDDHTIINKEPVNSCIEKNNSNSLTLQVKNTRQIISQTDRTSSVSKKVSFPIMSPLVTCLDKSAPVPSTNCLSPICNYSFDLTPKVFMIEKPFWNRKMQYDMKPSSKSTKPTENKRNSLNSSTEPKPSPRILPISYKATSEISQNKSSLKSSYFDDYTYILATDADMEFDDKSLVRLIDLCNRDKNIGGACGRTSPKGHCNTPVVWYQKFEYAKDFWMIKSSQNVIGCVMCCPGCFSLYRATAIQDVMHMYCEPIQSEFDVFVKDHGEDRWLCTLMMLKGWKLEYSSYSHNSTFCPDNFLEFLKQRKRWVLSEMSNLILVFGNIRRLTQNNSTFSLIYIIYILQMFLLVMLSPGTTVVVLTISLDILFGLSCLYTTPFCIGSLILYSVICSTKSIQAQSAVTSAITIFLGGIVLSVSVGYMKFFVVDTIDDLQDGQLQFKQYYLILLLMTAVLYAALIHPKEAWTLIHGLTFLVVFPAMYILLPFYAVSNIVDQRWGTRESDSDSTSCYRHMSDRLFAKEKNINKRQEIPESQQFNGERDLETCDPAKTILLQKEQTFWEDLRVSILGTDVNLGTDQVTLKLRLKILRNRLVGILLLCNIIWACLLSSLYLTISKHDTIFGIITCSVYSFSLLIQLIGLTAHKCDSFFREFVIRTFGKKHPIWIHRKD